MRSTRPVLVALAIGGAFLLSSCASGQPAETAAPCDELKSEVRDISNGTQNMLAAMTDPAEVTEYLETAQGRIEKLAQKFGDDDLVSGALSKLDDAIAGAAEAVATAPTVDPDAETSEPVDFSAEETAIQTAAAEASEACAG
ncbi:hypothetical protein [Agromyces archimandritae]|uniref:Mucin-associated surface protein n=1 Tax=Agromyces archimandritae TaxID=2781962 RepID=A0A975FM89_9MICO|nr:hypothetical protein [Agromyces archimandritae]QTX03571.1 hypothetical protein G127AT_09435 [Agromyces archimandritae]